jgi:F-type H+-transporting ATPase subunit delta
LRLHPVAKRYAKALFALANEKEQLEQIRNELNSFKNLLKEQSRLRSYLFSPEIEKNDKIKIAQELLQDKVSELFVQFILLLLKKGRQNQFSDIVIEFNRMYERKINRISATVTSAIELDQKLLDEFEKQLAAVFDAKISLNHKVEPEILGGFIVSVDGKAIDGSVRKQISELKESLSKKTIAIS